jgi:hypothetical protein
MFKIKLIIDIFLERGVIKTNCKLININKIYKKVKRFYI